MEPQEYAVRHFEAMAEVAADLRTLPSQILKHAYNYSAFGSWWTTLRRKGMTFRIVFDGKEQQLRREQASQATDGDSWEALDAWRTGVVNGRPRNISITQASRVNM